jgi:hypothetical protein
LFMSPPVHLLEALIEQENFSWKKFVSRCNGV